ncbi:hypothetical protein E3N88_03657 [Mikania micrantha]|uniref:Homeobox-leucine zipper protein n=1 Tax=Mikania micrantha TaxID=192012 RepID=A0A5N6Q9H3_9ASTR|nr:hypothetical protein E3N88_03657 [Mikania micrantha]
MAGGASSSPATTRENTTSYDQPGGEIKKNNKNCRRFSDDQIKSLESVFTKDNKLEPRKKLEMARELGLHPRQVAIWFQNRRARWKSKQVEQDYTNLKADYDSLSDRFESLKKERHELLQQLSNLCSRRLHEGSKDLDSGSENGEQDMGDDEDDPSCTRKEESNTGMGGVSEEIRHEKVSNFQVEGSLFDQSCSNWWDIWS